MQILFGLKKIRYPKHGSVVAVGIFDGVHRGHQKILKTAVERARKEKRSSVVITFHPHPAKILNPKKSTPLLISLRHRLYLTGLFGIDICIVINFNKRFSAISAQDFIEKILVKKLNTKTIIIGEDFLFGAKSKGNTSLLRRFAKIYKFRVIVLKDIRYHRRKISSTYIRLLTERGRLHTAASLLSRPVAIRGTVVRGSSRGRFLGYPTANINPHHEAIPPSGVYAVIVKLGNSSYKGILNVGFRPTFADDDIRKTEIEPTIEVHLFDFRRNIYGQDLEIEFVKRIRSEKRFASKEELLYQIRRDENRAKKIFRETLLTKELY